MADPKICAIEGCGKPLRKRGWCESHYKRWRRHGDPMGGGTYCNELRRFFQGVVLRFKGSECLIWPYTRNRSGYAQMRWDGRPQNVHRLVCEAVYGPPPTPQHEAAHNCGKGHEGCVTPRHAYWATPVENQADKIRHGTHNRGKRHPMAKLCEDDVLEIRALHGKLPERELARRFGVSGTQINNIHRRKSWTFL